MEDAAASVEVETPSTTRDSDKEHRWSPVCSERDLRARARQAINHDREIKAIFLFGSRARGTPRPNSDWDVAIVSTNDDVPTLGSNVDTTRINSRVRIGEITCRSALPARYRYGHRSVRDWAKDRRFAVMAMEFGACEGGTRARTMARTVPGSECERRGAALVLRASGRHRRPRRAPPDQPADGRTRRAALGLSLNGAAGRRHAASQAGATADAGGGGPAARCFEPR